MRVAALLALLLSFSSAVAYDIPLGRKYPPDLVLQESNPLIIPPDFDAMLPEPGLEVMTEKEREEYREKVLNVIFPGADIPPEQQDGS